MGSPNEGKGGINRRPSVDARRPYAASVVDLDVYDLGYRLAMEVFRVTRTFPPDERYALTDQVRRSSRSVCANLREAWAKRRYPAHFLSKLTDCDGENGETATWLNFARDCGYLTQDTFETMIQMNREVGAMLGAMIKNPAPFLQTPHAP